MKYPATKSKIVDQGKETWLVIQSTIDPVRKVYIIREDRKYASAEIYGDERQSRMTSRLEPLPFCWTELIGGTSYEAAWQEKGS